MKHSITSFLLLFALMLAACDKEAPFPPDPQEGTGQLSLKASDLSVTNSEIVISRAIIDPSDFIVEIVDADGAVRNSYRYGDMPEVVTLPVGDYVLRAHLGDNKDAAFDEPYFYGELNAKVEKDKVTEPGTIVCTLSNMKVTIIMTDELKEVLSDDAKVTVKAGEHGSLDFLPSETRSGYFRHYPGSSTLVAVFSGKVDGYVDNSTVTFTEDQVKPGHHYKITYRLHNPDDPNAGGYFAAGLVVDAKVEVSNLNFSVDYEEFLVDDWRNKEGDDGGGDDDQGDGPVLTPSDGVSFDTEMNPEDFGEGKKDCKLLIDSSADGGISGFVVEIGSDNDGFINSVDEMLGTRLDLINDVAKFENLRSLGLPCGEEVSGKARVEFNITELLFMLGAFPGHHTFSVSVTDANGTTKKTLRFAAL